MLKIFENIKFIKGHQAAGVYLNYLDDDILNIEYTLLKEKNSVVEIEKQESVNSFEELLNSINDSVPLFISIDGKGILHKKIEKDSGKDVDRNFLLNKAFPSLKIDEFYFQENEIDQNTVYLSLVRKNKIDKLLQDLNKRNFFVQNITLGPFDIKNILELIDSSNEFIWTDNYKIIYNKGGITDLIKTNKIPENVQNKFGGYILNCNNLTSFASAFLYFTQYSEHNSDLSIILSQQKEEFLFKKLFNMGTWVILILVFVTLLVNYMFFDHYNSKNNELIMKYDQHKSLIVKLERLKEELKTKEQFSQENNILKTFKLSFYADRISLLLPQTLSLSKMEIQPVSKKIQLDEGILFLKNIILINGVSDNSQNFNLWIKKLKKEPWIDKINIINYSQDNISKSSDFEIEIFIKK